MLTRDTERPIQFVESKVKSLQMQNHPWSGLRTFLSKLYHDICHSFVRTIFPKTHKVLNAAPTRKHSRRMHTTHLPTVSYCIPDTMSKGAGYLTPPPRHTHPTRHTHPWINPFPGHTHPPQARHLVPEIPMPWERTWYQRYQPPERTWNQRYPPPVDRMTDRYLWKHHLPPTSLAGGKYTLIINQSQPDYLSLPVLPFK